MLITKNSRMRDLPALVRVVYEEVWGEFFDWKKHYCATVLESLAANKVTHTRYRAGLKDGTESRTVLAEDLAEIDKCADDDDGFVCWEFSEDPQPSGANICADSVTVESIHPQLPYESVAPIYNNIRHGDDSDDMPFLPYADSQFDFKTHALMYRHFAWQDARSDPDCMRLITHFLTNSPLMLLAQ